MKNRVKELRDAKHLTQTGLALKVGSMGFPLRLFSWKSFYGHSPERNDYGKKKN